MFILDMMRRTVDYALNPYKQETFTPPREDRWQHINRLAAERGDNNINPMVWAGRRRVAQHRYHQALSPVGETVPSRRHNQSDSESGKEANEANTEEVPVSLLFFVSFLLVSVA